MSAVRELPEEVLTRTKKSETDVRSLMDRGRYVLYNYLRPKTGEPMEGGRVRLGLVAEDGRTEEFFVIPTGTKRNLLIPAAEKGTRKVWDGSRAVDLETGRSGRFKASSAKSTCPGRVMFECPGCGGKYTAAEMCEDCGVCTSCCEPGCACDGCLAGRTD